MKKLIFTMAVAACFAAAQAQTNEKRGSINLWGYVVDSFLQTGLEGANEELGGFISHAKALTQL